MSLPVLTNCDGCGACCRHMGTPPFVVFYSGRELIKPDDDDSWEMDEYRWLLAAPQEARDLIDDEIEKCTDEDRPCVWLDSETQRCRWHEFRPGICRDFEVGGESCLATRKHYQIANP